MSKLIIFTIIFGIYSGCFNFESSDTLHKHEKVISTAKLPTTHTYYTCSMHPKIKEGKPGKCPLCHMNLTKIETEEQEVVNQAEPNTTQKEIWYCRNFPEVTSEKEGPCPKDGAPMVLKQENMASQIVGNVRLRKAQLKHFNPAFFPVTTMKMSKTIRLLGSVLQSEEKESSIPADRKSVV